jgi:hypothetical protein
MPKPRTIIYVDLMARRPEDPSAAEEEALAFRKVLEGEARAANRTLAAHVAFILKEHLRSVRAKLEAIEDRAHDMPR